MLSCFRKWGRGHGLITSMGRNSERISCTILCRSGNVRDYLRASDSIRNKPLILVTGMIMWSYSFSSLVPRGQRIACTLAVVRRDKAYRWIFPRV